MNQTTQTHISYKKKKNTDLQPKKKSDLQKSIKHRFVYKEKKNPNLHDTGGDLQNFCMIGPSSRDLYKTYRSTGLRKKKKKKTRSTNNTNCNFGA